MKKTLKIVALTVQGVYAAVCLLEVIFCIVYDLNRYAPLGDWCFLAMIFLLYAWMLMVIPTLGSIVLNLVACLPLGSVRNAGDTRTKRVLWIVWTVLAPVLDVLLFVVLASVFVGTTGGV